MNKLLSLSAVAALLGLGLVGCELNPLEVDDDEVTIKSLTGFTTMNAGSDYYVTAEIDGNVALSAVNVTIESAAGANATAMFTITKQGITLADFEDLDIKKTGGDMYIKITPKADACNGSYTITLTAEAGEASSNKSDDFTVAGGKDCSGTDVATGTVTLGGHSHATLGSSVDLDNGEVMLAAAAKAAGSGVDIVYTYSSKTPAGPVLMSPAYAKSTSGISAFSTWSSPNATKFHAVDVDFDDVETAEEIADLFVAADADADGKLSVAVGDVIVVKTDEDAYVLLEMTTVSTDAAGTAKIKYGK
ncbi:MAG: hypothetical protein GX556_11905 [Fibrobacter sp.]|nr:hypothetical protein [Fibrobacter sp.]